MGIQWPRRVWRSQQQMRRRKTTLSRVLWGRDAHVMGSTRRLQSKRDEEQRRRRKKKAIDTTDVRRSAPRASTGKMRTRRQVATKRHNGERHSRPENQQPARKEGSPRRRSDKDTIHDFDEWQRQWRRQKQLRNEKEGHGKSEEIMLGQPRKRVRGLPPALICTNFNTPAIWVSGRSGADVTCDAFSFFIKPPSFCSLVRCSFPPLSLFFFHERVGIVLAREEPTYNKSTTHCLEVSSFFEIVSSQCCLRLKKILLATTSIFVLVFPRSSKPFLS